MKPDGGATGASSGIYQTAASTLTSNDGSYVYDKIAPQVSPRLVVTSESL